MTFRCVWKWRMPSKSNLNNQNDEFGDNPFGAAYAETQTWRTSYARINYIYTHNFTQRYGMSWDMHLYIYVCIDLVTFEYNDPIDPSHYNTCIIMSGAWNQHTFPLVLVLFPSLLMPDGQCSPVGWFSNLSTWISPDYPIEFWQHPSTTSYVYKGNLAMIFGLWVLNHLR